MTQIGRYFAITLNDKVTRLYTTVNFLVDENSHFLERVLKRYRNWLIDEITLVKHEVKQTAETTNGKELAKLTGNDGESADNVHNAQEIDLRPKKINSGIPIMFKTYAGGQWT